MSVSLSPASVGRAMPAGLAGGRMAADDPLLHEQGLFLTAEDPMPEPPEAPGPNECCESGCVPCVYDLYAEAMQEYRAALAAWEQRQAARDAKN
ncbi:oxidoreductase-like domain-containing protein [Kerstersia similis]|uniref:oxidoreductase-like domain-containing protein n=1 Tax=Kerstersia similis TaxID=206505 RepID=UPI0039EE2CE3